MALTPDEQAARSAGYATPEGTHYISEGDDAIRQNAVTSHKSVNDVRSESQTGIAAVRSESQADDAAVLSEALAAATAANPYKQVLPEGTDIDTLRAPGIYSVRSSADARTMINWPTIRAGKLEVSTLPGSNLTLQEVIAYVSTDSPVERYARGTIASSGGWGPWGTPEWTKGTITADPSGTNDLDGYNTPGSWIISRGSDFTGLPEELAIANGILLEVFRIPGSGVAVQRATGRVRLDSSLQTFQRMTLRSSGWAGEEWVVMGASGPPAPAPVASADPVSVHSARTEYARSRRGGGIGTAGLPVVMLRFDHWMVAFRDKVLPILREFDLPATLNLNYDNLTLAQNGGGSITWEDVQAWNQYDGIEIANHGSTHTNASTRDTIYHEIVNGRRNLEAAMPRVAVETWQEHGSAYLVAGDMPGDIGLNLGREPSNFFESYAGKLVLAEHAVIEGKSGGFFHPINGHPQIGQSHISIDRETASSAINYVDQVQEFGRGVTLYVHPGTLDTVSADGSITYMTTAAFYDFCSHLAAERDAGRVMVMTAAGGAFADRLSDYRENLIVSAGFTGNWESHWANYANYTVSSPGPEVTVTSSANATPLRQSMLLHSRFGWAMGAAHELLLRCRATEAGGQLTLRIHQLGDPDNWHTEKTIDVPNDGVFRDYRLNFTFPRDPSITQMTLHMGGPNLEISGPPLLAAI